MSFTKVLFFLGIAVALPDGFKFNIGIDTLSEKLQFNVTIPENTYLGIAFGKGMNGVDMVRFVGADDGYVEDLWSNFYW